MMCTEIDSHQLTTSLQGLPASLWRNLEQPAMSQFVHRNIFGHERRNHLAGRICRELHPGLTGRRRESEAA
jgi:hypothetical protein